MWFFGKTSSYDWEIKLSGIYRISPESVGKKTSDVIVEDFLGEEYVAGYGYIHLNGTRKNGEDVEFDICADTEEEWNLIYERMIDAIISHSQYVDLRDIGRLNMVGPY